MTYVRVRNNDGNSIGNSKKDKFEVDNFLFLPKLIYERHQEYLYLKLVEDILKNGFSKNDRTGTGTLSKFGCQVIAQILILCVIHIYSFIQF
jgi:dihydrofolate reductase / thymidylate synthase